MNAHERDPVLATFVREHLPALVRDVNPQRVLVYGSRARGDAIRESDLDVLVVADRFEGVPWPERAVLVTAGPPLGVAWRCFATRRPSSSANATNWASSPKPFERAST